MRDLSAPKVSFILRNLGVTSEDGQNLIKKLGFHEVESEEEDGKVEEMGEKDVFEVEEDTEEPSKHLLTFPMCTCAGLSAAEEMSKCHPRILSALALLQKEATPSQM